MNQDVMNSNEEHPKTNVKRLAFYLLAFAVSLGIGILTGILYAKSGYPAVLSPQRLTMHGLNLLGVSVIFAFAWRFQKRENAERIRFLWIGIVFLFLSVVFMDFVARIVWEIMTTK